MKGVSAWFRAHPWVVFLVVALVAVVSRVLVEGTTSWDRGVSALEKGEKEEALFQFRKTARWVAPGFSLPKEALLTIEEMGNGALEECKTCSSACTVDSGEACKSPACEACSFAVYAFDSGRAAILGSRSFYTPHSEILVRMNAGLVVALSRAAEVYPPGPRQPPETREERIKEHQEQMELDHAPDVMFSLISSLGFAAWLAFLLLGLLRWSPSSSSKLLFTSRRCFGISIGSFGLWVVGLLML